VQLQARGSAHPYHFDVLPKDAQRLTGSERFHCRFFHRESAGQVRNWVSSLCTIGNLTVCENPVQKALAVAFEEVGDAPEIRRIQTNADDVHV
jgi:hypothetical protein